MAKSIYITSAEGHTGKSAIALGVLDLLTRTTARVGVFRPITRSREEIDSVLAMLLEHDGVDLDAAAATGVTYDEVRADPEAALSQIVERFNAVRSQCETVVIIGSDYTDVASPTELGFNARIAANLGAPVLLVLGGRAQLGQGEQLGTTTARTAAEIAATADIAMTELRHSRAQLLAAIVNRADPTQSDAIIDAVSAAIVADGAAPGTPVWAIPEDRSLVAPSVRGIMQAVDGRLIQGDPELMTREVLSVVVAGMSMVNVLPRLQQDAMVVIAADRTDVLLATLLANASGTFPSVSGILLNGPFPLPEEITRLLDGLSSSLPVIATDLGTYDTALRVMRTRGRLASDSRRRIDTALTLFDTSVDTDVLAQALGVASTDVVTPLMFQYALVERARADRRHIVLPEGDDDRILRAAATLEARGVAELTILGDEQAVRARAVELGVDLGGAHILSPFDPELVKTFAAEYTRLRAHKGMTLERAADTVTDVSYFGTMMVHLGLADGMVSGAAHTTAHTIRPAFEIIKTRPGTSVVSSVFLMALADRVLVYGDCAVIPDPTSEQLADIAISSAATATQFGISPRVAMLSYSTGESGSGADVDKVRAATALVRERAPELLVEGPIQYDAAADAAVAAAKMPGSEVAGRATVFIFPDLNTGNNTYKAVQRSAGAVAMGPVLQGLNRPINDLSRGALVEDIINTVAITAIQAQGSDVSAVLVINSGSSSFKYELLEMEGERVLASGLVERIGESSGAIHHTVYAPAGGVQVAMHKATYDRDVRIPDHTTGFALMLEAFDEHGPQLTDSPPIAVGHRVVHGGARFFEPTLVTPLVEINIDDLSTLAPLHNPGAVEGIIAAKKAFADVPHVAVFDTAFHQTLKPAAFTYAIDADVAHRHRIRRYGFHGTSHKYVSETAAAFLGRDNAELRQIVFHLGNGASVTAIDGGRSVDTSMGFTPLEGLVMGTRSGDLDPAVLFQLARRAEMSTDELDRLLNKQSGLLGLAGVSDMRDVLEGRERGDERAALAFDVYIHRLKHYLGAYLAVLGGVDVISFTAGVGENAAAVRAAALAGAEWAGIELDAQRNATRSGGPRVISTDTSRVTVLVVPTNEELEIARQTLQAIAV